MAAKWYKDKLYALSKGLEYSIPQPDIEDGRRIYENIGLVENNRIEEVKGQN